MSTCPYCGTTYHSTHAPISLSARQRVIYDTVASGGHRGVTVKSLLNSIFGDKHPESAWGVLRVNVFEMNRKLKEHGQRIKGRKNIGYILVEDEDKADDRYPEGERDNIAG